MLPIGKTYGAIDHSDYDSIVSQLPLFFVIDHFRI